MLMRNESISDSLVAMLGSCSSSPRHLAPPGVCGGCIDRSQTCCGGNLGFNAADFCWILGYSASRSANVCMEKLLVFICSEFKFVREFVCK